MMDLTLDQMDLNKERLVVELLQLIEQHSHEVNGLSEHLSLTIASRVSTPSSEGGTAQQASLQSAASRTSASPACTTRCSPCRDRFEETTSLVSSRRCQLIPALPGETTSLRPPTNFNSLGFWKVLKVRPNVLQEIPQFDRTSVGFRKEDESIPRACKQVSQLHNGSSLKLLDVRTRRI
jgi:hypothetical protein